MALVSVVEAAHLLGVSVERVRQRIRNGSLPALKVGNQWGIDPDLLQGASPLHSRPMSRRMAWAFIEMLGGSSPDVSPAERLRLRNRAEALRESEDPAQLLRSWASSRAERRQYAAAAPDLDELRADHRLHLSGLSAADSGVIAGGIVEAYVASGDVPGLVADYFLVEPQDHRGNVVLHVLDDDDKHEKHHDHDEDRDEDPEHVRDELRRLGVSWPLIAIDLSEHSGAREQQRAAELVREWLPA
jgi:excisionase family DNA binding protein